MEPLKPPRRDNQRGIKSKLSYIVFRKTDEKQHFCKPNFTISILKNIKAIRIGYGAFYNCLSLCYALIPESVTTLGANAFAECDFFGRNSDF